jgi:hypothetical protein
MALVFSSKPASVSEVILEEHLVSEHKRKKFVLRKFFMGTRPLGAVHKYVRQLPDGSVVGFPFPENCHLIGYRLATHRRIMNIKPALFNEVTVWSGQAFCDNPVKRLFSTQQRLIRNRSGLCNPV